MIFKDKILNTLYNSEDNNNEIIYGMWMGEDLSFIEQLSISSFLKNGHKYVLYVYGDINNIPDGVEVRDAHEILDDKYLDKIRINMPSSKCYPTFANWFRYKLLYKYGGWWADLDMICLKPLDFTSPYVFSHMKQLDFYGNQIVNNGIIKSPSHASIFKFYSELCDEKMGEVGYGETGPLSFYYIIKKYGLTACIYPFEVFEPSCRVNVFKKNIPVSPKTYVIHLHNQFIKNKIDKNKTYSSDSLIEKLKKKYLRGDNV